MEDKNNHSEIDEDWMVFLIDTVIFDEPYELTDVKIASDDPDRLSEMEEILETHLKNIVYGPYEKMGLVNFLRYVITGGIWIDEFTMVKEFHPHDRITVFHDGTINHTGETSSAQLRMLQAMRSYFLNLKKQKTT